jgi:hypothetical protein
VKAVHCNGRHPCLEDGEQDTIWIMTCSPLISPEDLKVLIREGISKICPLANVPREYEALHFCMAPGEPSTQGRYLLVGLSMTSGMHMCLRDVLLHQPDSLQESPPLALPCYDPPYTAPTTSETLDSPRN